MRRMSMLRSLVLLLLLACTPMVGAAPGSAGAAPASEARGSNKWPASGRIVFEVLRGENGLKLGEAQHVWEHDGRRYTMETVLETTGLAGMLYDFRYVQRSEGLVSNDGLRPTRFGVEQAGKEPEAARFDWKEGKVTIERRGRASDHPISSPDQDVLSVWHLVGVRKGRPPPAELTVVTGRTAAPATFAVLGDETITIPAGRIDALKVRVKARSGKLTIDLWLSKAHSLLPVRILMTDHKGEVLDQRAVSIDRSTARDTPDEGRHAQE